MNIIKLCVSFVLSFFLVTSVMADERNEVTFRMKGGLQKTDEIYQNIEYITKLSSISPSIRHPGLILYSPIDINSDGINELVVKNTSTELCKQPKCPIIIAKINSDMTDWDIILETMSWKEEVFEVNKKIELIISDMYSSVKYVYNPVTNKMEMSKEDFGKKSDVLSFIDMSNEYQSAIEYVLSDALGERYLIMKNQNPNLKNVFFAEADLNHDSVNEYFVFYDLEGKCGKDNLCDVLVYSDMNSKPIIKFQADAMNFHVGEPMNEKISDLLIGYNGKDAIIEWNLNENVYVLKK